MRNLTTEKLFPNSSNSRMVYVVKSGDQDVGLIYTYRDTKTTRSPWTVLRGVGAHQDLAGHSWGSKADAVKMLQEDINNRTHYNYEV